MVNAESIKQFFRMLNGRGLTYVLIKNDGGLIPNRVADGNDVDILIHPDHYEKFLDAVRDEGFERLPGESKKYFFLYKMRSDIYLRKDDAFFHAYDRLACVSFTNMGLSKIPLDNEIQQYIWRHRIWDESNGWWINDDVVILLYLIIRSVFDKQRFRPIYIAEIELREDLLDDSEFVRLCRLVFFRYSERLIEMLRARRYDEILLDYQHFCDY